MSKDAVINQEAVETVKDIIKDVETAMLSTISEGGINSRPMQTQDIEFDGDLWFLTKKDTSKYKEILENPNVNVAYVGKSYVSIRGTAEIVDDLNRKKELWNKMYEKFLDTTYDDPNIILIKIRTETAEYWETGDRMKTVKAFFRKMTGQRQEEDSELNKTVDLHK
ncbi:MULTISPECIES: pyridoxamine 5'-phosphate oxidase family protein [Paenibacillus]|jgi:general stress protein 26|uniref:Pyridoxamine 5'-phosphate oxidase-related FMN-binding n=2 Tax=Paenibacillus lactis TaxID=228574 RepID=G4HMX5_9BACL|nr:MULTISPECIES: pyridoxamine 5'-phosphate oxidase family protein [Paenibacillus]EHB54340.1 pyridoxamine 5'-phosphate oxidase-related FMN-binding [Paenibacillus lactis 154]MBP1891598.1 general stress protein 26 [Paenibacillus lactis]MCM3494061.1 pyridoxamine 5'-phosphate oxidase family protein [Paenibacillus lactis]GIO88839.1 general stress protein [Paenibacillus lactis]HAG00398.1 general stress protein [Paenibacillus lactis]